MERKLEVDFQEFKIGVSSEIGQSLDRTTTFAFYATLEYLRKKNKK